MQDEVNEKTVALCVKGGKISAQILKSALIKLLAELEKKKQHTGRQSVVKHGKQSLKNLIAQGSQLTNIEVTDNNIKSFDRVARKYGIDYSLKKDHSTEPPRYLAFFRARDVDVMTAAFREYTGITLKKEDTRESIRKKLEQAREKCANHRELHKEKHKDRGQTR